jgi:hypothetical protein
MISGFWLMKSVEIAQGDRKRANTFTPMAFAL